jgi:aminopeptidase
MKNFTRLFWSGCLLLLINPFVFSQKQPNYVSIADNIVNTALNVKPGEIVVINGSEVTLTLMHELFVAVSKAGGKAVLEFNIPEATKRAIMETPMEYLKMPNTYDIVQARAVDCFINLNKTDDANLFDDVPEERFAAVRQAAQPVNEAQRRAHYRSVSLGQVGGIPSHSYSQKVGADLYEMISMFWSAVDADYVTMEKSAREILKKLKPGSDVKVTSEAGTNLTFKLDYTGARINCGITDETVQQSGPSNTWLPAGEAYSSVVPTSANGVLVIPHTDFRGGSIKNLKLTFDEGRIVQMTADENLESLKKALEISTGMKDVLSLFDIGLNPHSRPLNNYLSYEMAGVVTLGVGNNAWAGGDVNSDFNMDFQLKNTTVMIDNEMVVEHGKLK